jgi:hypothetical protein
LDVLFETGVVKSQKQSDSVPHLENFDPTSTNNYAVWSQAREDFFFTGITN